MHPGNASYQKSTSSPCLVFVFGESVMPDHFSFVNERNRLSKLRHCLISWMRQIRTSHKRGADRIGQDPTQENDDKWLRFVHVNKRVKRREEKRRNDIQFMRRVAETDWMDHPLPEPFFFPSLSPSLFSSFSPS